MNIFRLLFELFLLYLLYKLVFRFIIPVYQTTKIMKQKMNKMQEDINRSRPQPQPEPPKSKDIEGEYIDYEEIR
ncbi:MAG: hypothetical protein JSR00_05045 [Bacteroidetes bacterium]|nr:hypothetical protein [Bacteroidota bacterium]